jgi:hypothetical protein
MRDRRQEPRRWRTFECQPRDSYDWPAKDWEDGALRYLENIGDPIIVYQSCNGYALWRDTDDAPPPAEQWIALPPRPKQDP